MCGRFRVRGKFVDGLPSDTFVETRIEVSLRDRFNVSPGQRASLAELDVLFAILQHRAFRGEL